MPIWAALLGWLLTVGQALWRLKTWAGQRVRDENLRTVRDDVRAVRDKLAKALSPTGVLKGEAERQWAQAVDDSLRLIESHIGTAIGGKHAPKH